MKRVYRGEIYYADLSPVQGSEQGGLRPVCIIQNDVGNRYSPTTIVAVMTSKIYKREYPTSVYVSATDTGLKADSRVCCEQIRVIDKERLKQCMGALPASDMRRVDEALKISLGMGC